MATNIVQPLEDALNDFQSILSTSQRTHLQELNILPDAHAVLTFTAEIDIANAKRRSRGVASRLVDVLQSVQQFSDTVDTFVSSSPAVAALVWGSIKFTILAVSHVTSYFDQLSEWFMKLRSYYPRYSEYQLLFPTSERLRFALCKFYAEIVRSCKHAIELIQNQGILQVAKAIFIPFEREFSPFQVELQKRSHEVNEEVRLASIQAAHQEQQLQDAERKQAGLFRFRHDEHWKQSLEWRLQRDRRRKGRHRRKLLDKLSIHDHVSALKQERKKRHSQTSTWLCQTEEFNNWLNESESSLFWCSGHLGTGKTVLTAYVIDELLRHRATSDNLSFFFCRFDNEESLKARTILGCLIRQSIDAKLPFQNIEAHLQSLFENSQPDAQELQPLFDHVASLSKTHIFVIDAMDECEEVDRQILLSALTKVMRVPQARVKVFITSRETMNKDIYKHFESFHSRTMSGEKVHIDVQTYIKATVQEKLNSGDLVVGQKSLIPRIEQALVKNAQGMFLWVPFQLGDICSRTCDEDIQQAIENLPQTLPKIFERALQRIIRIEKSDIAGKIFRWVATAKRPLTLFELREAIAIEPCQPFSRPERYTNNIDQLVRWCSNLVVLDEEDNSVHFAHHTIKEFLMKPCAKFSLDKFHFLPAEASLDIGRICVTYLNFNDFKTQLVLSPSLASRSQTSRLIQGTIPAELNKRFKNLPLAILNKARGIRAESSGTFDLATQLFKIQRSCTDRVDQASPEGQEIHPFFPYAKEYWLAHTMTLKDDDTGVWRLWRNLVDGTNIIAPAPWGSSDWERKDRYVLQWIVENNHQALMEFAGFPNFPSKERKFLLEYAILHGYEHSLEKMLRMWKTSPSQIEALFHYACQNGIEDVPYTPLTTRIDIDNFNRNLIYLGYLHRMDTWMDKDRYARRLNSVHKVLHEGRWQ